MDRMICLFFGGGLVFGIDVDLFGWYECICLLC